MRLIIIAALVATAPPLPAAEPTAIPPAARAAAATVDAFHGALRAGDTRSAASLLDDDALIFESGHVERSKAEYAAHHLPADAEFSKAVSSAIIRRTGNSTGQMAWISTEGRTTGTFHHKKLDERTTETVVLRREKGGWKIVHIHWSSAAAH